MTCAHCGQEMPPHPRGHEKRFCSRRCSENDRKQKRPSARRRERRRERNRASKARKDRVTRVDRALARDLVCGWCSARLENGHQTEYCSRECRAQGMRWFRVAQPLPLRRDRVLYCCEVCGGWVVRGKPRRYCSRTHAMMARRGQDYKRSTEAQLEANRVRTREQYGSAWAKARTLALASETLCRECHSPATEVDHIVPIVDGGTHEPGNLQPLCHNCHRVKTVRDRAGRRQVYAI